MYASHMYRIHGFSRVVRLVWILISSSNGVLFDLQSIDLLCLIVSDLLWFRSLSMSISKLDPEQIRVQFEPGAKESFI